MDRQRNEVDRLAEAAPDLLEAVLNLMGLFDNPVYRRRLAGDRLYSETIDHARAAIRKARGQADTGD